MATRAQRNGASDARTWLAETESGEWPDVLLAEAGEPDAALLSGIGTEATARLFGVRGYWRGVMTRAFSRALDEYNTAWRRVVARAVKTVGP